MTGMTLASWLKHFQRNNGLKKVSPHGLRYSNTIMLITNGADIKTVSARLGRADVKITLNIYSQYTTEADRKVSNLIDELLSG
ncbi:MAG: tyrosine-type recombinase/integrase [Firmicutes bacterium]|nr:tyrosine-type recombinase/integrase [Bacillota bacterium]